MLFWKAYLWLCRKTWITIKWVFLLTLPLTFFPGIMGIIHGLYIPFWMSAAADRTADAWSHDLQVVSRLTQGSVHPQDSRSDFKVPRLTSNDWAAKLGFVQPEAYTLIDDDIPLDNFAAFDGLMAASSTCLDCGPAPPKEQWVYVSDLASPSLDPWNAAFDDVVQSAYAPSSLNKTRLFSISCHEGAKYLCGVWRVRSPTLMHFTVGDSPPRPENMDPDLTYEFPFWKLRPVTVRAIELPFESRIYTGLPSTVLPGPTEVMLSIIGGDRLYEQFGPWMNARQIQRRWIQHLVVLHERKGHPLYYLSKADIWTANNLARPLGFGKM